MIARTSKTAMSIFMVAGLLMILNVTAIAAEAVNATTVAERMDKTKYASSEIKSYLKGLKGNTITADGNIKDILTGKTGNRVVLHVNAGKSGDFVVDVYADTITDLHKGDHVSCKGKYAKYNPFTVNGITLREGSCSKK